MCGLKFIFVYKTQARKQTELMGDGRGVGCTSWRVKVQKLLKYLSYYYRNVLTT